MQWHLSKCEAHRSFVRVEDAEAMEDPCVRLMLESTEEGKKVARNQGSKFFAVFRRRRPEELPAPALLSLFED